MPVYRVTDPQTGRKVRLTGESPPTEQELNQIFSQVGGQEQRQEAPPAESVGMRALRSVPIIGQFLNIAAPAQQEVQAAQQAIPSAGRLVGDVARAVTSPVQTAKTLGKAAMGFGEKGLEQVGLREEGTSSNEEIAQSILDMFKDRYGSKEKLRETAINDPAGFLADAAGLVSGAGTAAGVAGKAGKVGGLQRAGQAAQAVSSAIDPVQVGARAVGSTARAAGRATGNTVAGALGISTGAGTEAIRNAFRGGDEFSAALRGETTADNIVTISKDALQDIKNQRRTRYLQELEQATDIPNTLDIKPVKSALDEALEEFNIRKTKDGFDFSRSTIADDAKRVEGVASIVDDWGSQAGDLTVAGVDTLKKKLDDFFSPSSREANAFVQKVKSKVRDVLNEQVPGYSDVTKNYREASELIDDIERALSLKSKNADAAFKKIISAVRNNQELRLEILRQLQEKAGVNIEGAASGLALQPITPRGLVGPLGAAGGAIGALTNPAFLSVLPFTSPRLVGELVKALGAGSRAVGKATQPVRSAASSATSNPALNDLLRILGGQQEQ